MPKDDSVKSQRYSIWRNVSDFIKSTCRKIIKLSKSLNLWKTTQISVALMIWVWVLWVLENPGDPRRSFFTGGCSYAWGLCLPSSCFFSVTWWIRKMENMTKPSWKMNENACLDWVFLEISAAVLVMFRSMAIWWMYPKNPRKKHGINLEMPWGCTIPWSWTSNSA